jgi:TRAP-type C4-dicarboxylate transport system permease small subunit
VEEQGLALTERLLRRVEDVLHAGGCISLVLVVVLLNADILLRVVFGRPVQIQFEFTELFLMPAIGALSLSRVFRDGGHLALDFGLGPPAGPLGRALDKLRFLLPAIFFAATTWMSGAFALSAILAGEVEYGVIDWPLGWAYAATPIGCGVLTLRLFHDAFAGGAKRH